MKARKTTFEERVEIVNYCITNNNNYSETAIKYSVPYSLVYQWVMKYNKFGIDALKYQKKGLNLKKNLYHQPLKKNYKQNFKNYNLKMND